jgi:hypothetical protein
MILHVRSLSQCGPTGEHGVLKRRLIMRTSEAIIAISLRNLNRDMMRKAKAEAQEIAHSANRSWVDIYYERNLADVYCHYEPSVPKSLTVSEHDAVIDLIDSQFKRILESV